MTTRLKTLGVAAAAAALAISTAITANADEDEVTIEPPAVHGSGCDAIKAELAPTGLDGLFKQPASAAIAAIPSLSTYNAAISGGLNPAVNVVGVLDNGPYNVFAPTDEAFSALDPAEFEALKADPARLTAMVYYSMALGLLGPEDVHGKLTSQEGKQITVTGKGGDIKVDDTAKVVCAGITADNAKIYMIDTVLSPDNALPATATTTTSPTETTEPTEATETTEPTEPTETTESAEPAEAPETTEAA